MVENLESLFPCNVRKWAPQRQNQHAKYNSTIDFGQTWLLSDENYRRINNILNAITFWRNHAFGHKMAARYVFVCQPQQGYFFHKAWHAQSGAKNYLLCCRMKVSLRVLFCWNPKRLIWEMSLFWCQRKLDTLDSLWQLGQSNFTQCRRSYRFCDW